jgi:hypothetical protein
LIWKETQRMCCSPRRSNGSSKVVKSYGGGAAPAVGAGKMELGKEDRGDGAVLGLGKTSTMGRAVQVAQGDPFYFVVEAAALSREEQKMGE